MLTIAVAYAITSNSLYGDAVRNAVSLGGDSDTLACIAEAYYKEIPLTVLQAVRERLTGDLWAKTLLFYRRYGINRIMEQMNALDPKR